MRIGAAKAVAAGERNSAGIDLLLIGIRDVLGAVVKILLAFIDEREHGLAALLCSDDLGKNAHRVVEALVHEIAAEIAHAHNGYAGLAVKLIRRLCGEAREDNVGCNGDYLLGIAVVRTAAAARADRGQFLYLVAVNRVIVAENVIGLLVVILNADHHVHDIKVRRHARRARTEADNALDVIGYLDLTSPCIGHNAHFLRGVFLCSILLRGRSTLFRCRRASAGCERQQRRKREYYSCYFFRHLFFPPVYLSGAEVIGLRSADSS